MPAPRNGSRPDVPTRLAEKTKKRSDRFETRVYQETENLFYTLNKNVDPSGRDWVLVELHNGEHVFEIYEGQNFIALVKILDFYGLPNGSEQWRPQKRHCR